MKKLSFILGVLSGIIVLNCIVITLNNCKANFPLVEIADISNEKESDTSDKDEKDEWKFFNEFEFFSQHIVIVLISSIEKYNVKVFNHQFDFVSKVFKPPVQYV